MLQAAGASAAVVIQTAPAWPYTMTDGAGEAAGGQLRIPVVMLRQVSVTRLPSHAATEHRSILPPALPLPQDDGRRLLRELRAAVADAGSGGGGGAFFGRLMSTAVGSSGSSAAAEEIAPSSSAAAATAATAASCAICCEAFARGDSAVLMPCLHPFHDACLQPWLARRHTCPVCRTALPTQAEAEVAAGAGATGTAAARRGDAAAAAAAARAAREAMVGGWYQ